jgi:ferritin-like metal-binding protein YciE
MLFSLSLLCELTSFTTPSRLSMRKFWAAGKHCDGIAGIIEEGKSVMEEDFDDTTMDACLIAAGQRAEHYEMAAYGTLVAWASAMGHTEAA